MENRNLLLAFALSMMVMIIWQVTVLGPQQERMREQQRIAAEAAAEKEATGMTTGDVPGSKVDLSALPDAAVDRDSALASAPGRIDIETDLLTGSLNLRGARIDDISLKTYRETLEKDSPIMVMLTPRNTAHGHYIQTGMLAGTDTGETAVWTAEPGAKLTSTTPVTLTRSSGELDYQMTISVDDGNMFTVEQSITNNGEAPVNVMPYGITIQRDMPEDLTNFMILHEGPLAIVDEKLYDRKYKDMKKKGGYEETGTSGWVGLTNKLWLAAAIPPQGERFTGQLKDVGAKDEPLFRASYMMDQRPVASGDSYSVTSHMFAGAKKVAVLKQYQAPVSEGGIGVAEFDRAVDWGWAYFITRPLFSLMQFFAGLTGNYGVAILLMTLVLKAILFPLANKSFESMAAMKKLQPELTRLKTQYADDKMVQQQKMMELYKKEKINPMAGCWPMLIQMPVFYALYKMLFVTIETRHEGFLYIRDLSVQDPTSIFNLFGLIPWDPSTVPVIGAFLMIGILPLLMGVAMWVQTKLSPPAGDPVQQQVMAMMPIMFVFIFAPFAAALVLYWFWNTFLGVVQQYYIMKRSGAEIDLLGNIKQSFGKKTPAVSNDNDK